MAKREGVELEDDEGLLRLVSQGWIYYLLKLADEFPVPKDFTIASNTVLSNPESFHPEDPKAPGRR